MIFIPSFDFLLIELREKIPISSLIF
jgi:hypothetical protein